MSEFIGAHISLISKSDIRYVGTLIEINSEDSTVALENVTSFGTEGRRDNIADEVAPSDSVYEYIVFRGSDVKDLRIEESPKENEPPKPPQVPNDPAILGSGSRPMPHNGRPQQMHQGANGFQQPPQYPPFPQQHYNQFPQQRFPGGPQQGFQGPPGGFQGYPGPYGPPPPAWYPPPGQGFPHQAGPPGPFGAPNQPQHFGGPGHQSMPQPPQGQKPTEQPQTGAVAQELESSTQRLSNPNDTPAPIASRGAEAIKATPDLNKALPLASAAAKPPAIQTPTPSAVPAAAPRPPVETKPDVASALAAPASAEQSLNPNKAPPTGPRSGRIVPAMPLTSPAAKTATRATLSQPQNEVSPSPDTNQNQAMQYQNSTQAATAAVAAAMAKLPPSAGQKPKQANEGDAMDNLTRKVNEMRTDDRIRHGGRQPGAGGYAVNNRGARGGPRRGGGREQQPNKPVEVPTTDFDFESSNAKFNKHDLVKETIASGSPMGTPGDGEAPSFSNGDAASPEASGLLYTKSSFFDNISSEARDREDAADGKQRAPGVQEFRSEERRRNFETFGQGSVDNGYRGGFRGGRGGRGRGGFRGGRGAFTGGYGRGGRGGSYNRGGAENGANGGYQDGDAAAAV